jgi:hypothetical protein
MKHPFQVGGKYRNRDGEYEVIRLDDRKMEIQYTSGRVLETDPGEVTLDVTGGFVTESLGSVLASVSGGDTGLMQSLVENPQVNEYVRSAALSGIVCLVVEGVKERE